MPIGISDVTTMTQLTDITEAELEREFGGDVRSEEEGGEEEEEEEEEGREEDREVDAASSRAGSSTSRNTGSACSDQRVSRPGSSSQEGDSKMPAEDGSSKPRKGQALWQTVKKAGGEINQDTRRVFRFIGRKLQRRHGPRETKVKEIHILPGEDDDRMWATRMAGSATSRSSTGSDPVSSDPNT